MYLTQWVEVVRFTWTCYGCSRECQVFCKGNLKKGEVCDATREGVRKILESNNATLQCGNP